ncbi:MAG TPA: FHIPEP family type III secretion protein, partial [Kofleriaceae bacterium]
VIAAAAALLSSRARAATMSLSEAGADQQRGTRITLLAAPALYDRLAAKPAELHEILAAARGEFPPLAVARDASLRTNEIALALDGTPVTWLTLDGEPLAALTQRLPAALAPLAPELLTVDRTAQLVDRAAIHVPVLVKEVVPKIVTLPVLAEVLRQLAREGVPVDDLAPILEAIALAPQHADVPVLVEYLRGQLRRQITARWAPRGQVAVYTVDAMIEDAVRSAIDRRDGAQILALEPAIAQDIVAAVRGKVGTTGVLLVSSDVRRHLRGLLEPELPEVTILAAHELAPGTAVTTAGRVDVG